MGRTPAHGLLVLALTLALAGCRDEDAATTATEHEQGGTRDSTSWADRLEAPTVSTALAALAQGHGRAREGLGPHRLEYAASFSLVPERDPGPARVGAGVPPSQAIEDSVSLTWAASPGDPPRFHLDQHNDQDRGREVIIVDDRVYTRMWHRGWKVAPVQSRIHELWLDDAQRVVHDAVELAAPRLTIEAGPGDDSSFGGASVKLTLSTATGSDDSLRPDSGWRRRAEIGSVSGEIILHRDLGLWESARIDVRYALEDDAGRRLRGQLTVRASVEPVTDVATAVVAPADAEPQPTRSRLEVERHKLLDGLAAP